MNQGASPLLTDLYQLNMIEAYLAHGETRPAVFELFMRKLPARRGFLMAAGLEQALDFLETLHFSQDEIDWLKGTRRFSSRTLDYLAGLRFSGDVHAMAEGTVFFADEPMLRVTAPLPEAQLVEARLINILHFQTLIASKAARVVLAAPGKLLVDFGLRRAHGAEAGLMAARASYIAGFAGTATVLAGKMFGIPLFGTMAHSYIQANDDEAVAFERFARARPDGLVLLLDTYDTEAAARKVVALAPKLKDENITIGGVRLDSGDLIALSRTVRRILDDGGLKHVTIFASGGLDEEQDRGHRQGGGADRRLRRRHQHDHLGGRARPRLRLQAARLRRPAAAQAIARQGNLARAQASLAPLRRRWPHGRRCHLGRGRRAVRRDVDPRGDARGQAPRADAIARR